VPGAAQLAGEIARRSPPGELRAPSCPSARCARARLPAPPDAARQNPRERPSLVSVCAWSNSV
jgi:hypothetical protein